MHLSTQSKGRGCNFSLGVLWLLLGLGLGLGCAKISNGVWREGWTILGKENLNPFESASSSRKSRAWSEMITFWTRVGWNSANQNPKNSALENSGMSGLSTIERCSWNCMIYEWDTLASN